VPSFWGKSRQTAGKVEDQEKRGPGGRGPWGYGQKISGTVRPRNKNKKQERSSKRA